MYAKLFGLEEPQLPLEFQGDLPGLRVGDVFLKQGNSLCSGFPAQVNPGYLNPWVNPPNIYELKADHHKDQQNNK
jgi:hypothetical protein